ncbi:hypothetical protein [Mesoaciditoga lauensis]|uniref:hypothetical protein n=1 Tax=Mesoaciditoga lauensis TaxID=1495039 RepID=UPI00055D8314|nr:hypothetical protein [Mesoaciditoga lauensis]
MKDNNAYYVVRLVIFFSLVGIVLVLIGWMVGLNGKVNDMAATLKDEQKSIASLLTSVASVTEKVESLTASRVSNNISVNLPSLGATSVNVQPIGYTALLRDAPLSLSASVALSTISSTNLSTFKPILSKVNTYEIAQANGEYYLAYPAAFGKTYSIQLLSSPYPDRVLDILKTLRSMGQPAFKIDYANGSALFLGVFPTYSDVKKYFTTLDASPIVKVAKTKPSNWVLRTIP